MAEPQVQVDGARAGRRWDLALLALALLFALTDLGGRSLHDMDVPRSGALAREMIRTGEWIVPLRAGEMYANKPPLYLWLVAGPSKLLGDVTPFTARLPAALALVLLVMATSWWGRVRLRSAAAGRAAALLTLSTFCLAWLGREGRLDMLAASLAVAATALLDAAAHDRGPRRAAPAAGLLLGLALLTKGPLVLLLPVAVLVLGSEPGTSLGARVRAARPLAALGVAALMALAWFVPALLQGGGEYARTLLLDQATTRIGGSGNHLQAPGFYLVQVALTGAPWGVFYLLTMGASAWPRAARALGPAAGLARAALVLLVLYSLVPTKHIRYLAPVLPLPAIVLAGWAWPRLAAATAHRRRALALLPPVLLVTAVAAVVACLRSEIGGLAAVVPAAGMVLLAGWAWRRRGAPHAFATAVLLAAVCVMSAVTVLRYRFRVPGHVRFNRQVAALLEEQPRPVFTEHPLAPEDLFLGAPEARALTELPDAALPQGALVICHPFSRADLEARLGRTGRVIATEPREGGRLVLTFE